jgi:ubiquitin carboxyl-terminal hydrolase 5/13
MASIMQVMFSTHPFISRLLLLFTFVFDTLLHLYIFFLLFNFFFHFRYFEKQSLKAAFATAPADPTVDLNMQM